MADPAGELQEQPPPDIASSPELRPAAPGEGSDATEARGARETVGFPQRGTPKPQPAAPKAEAPVRESTVEENPYERHVNGPQDDGPANLERGRLNVVNSYYRGTLAGASGLAAMAHVYQEDDPPDMDPDMKAARQRARDQYETIVSDLIAYDVMPTWSGLPQLAMAVGGSVAGSLPSPESFAGWAAKGSTWVARTMWSALQQGLITGASDPIVQMLNIGAGVQDEYHPEQTAGALVFGAALGGGFHAAGEGVGHLIGQRALRKQLYDLSQADNDLITAEMGSWAQDRRNGIEVRPTEVPREPGPATSFEEEIAAERKRLDMAYSTAETPYGNLDDRARVSVFNREVGRELEAQLEGAGLTRDEVADIHNYYDRQPGETPRKALDRALDARIDAQVRAVLENPDAALGVDLQRDLEDFLKAYESDALRGGGGGTSAVRQLGESGRYIPGEGPLGPARVAEGPGIDAGTLVPEPLADIPFQSTGGQHEQGKSTETGGARGAAGQEGGGGSGEGAGTAKAGEVPAAGGDLGRPAGETGGAAERGTIGAEGQRGERVEGPALTPEERKAKFDEMVALGKEEVAKVQRILDEVLAQETPKLVLTKGDRKKLISRSTTGGETPYRITDFDAEGPSGHRDYRGNEKGVYSLVDEVRSALREGYEITEGLPATTERTAQGEQTLIPGVEPVTDRQRLEAVMDKPLRGGDKPLDDGLFDVAGRGQTDAQLPPSEREAQALMPSRGQLMPGEERRGVWVDPSAVMSPTEARAIKSRHELSLQLADLLDFPLRQGKVTIPDAAGMYVGKSGVVRVKEIADFEIVKHEAGHAMEAKIGPQMTALITTHGLELGRLDYDQTKLRPNEGFAEWMRVRITHPAGAARMAPNFNIAFDSWMRANRPDMLKIINDIGMADRAWLNADPLDALGAVVKETFPDGHMTKAWKDLTKNGIMATPETILQKLYEGFVDTYAPIERALRDMQIELRDLNARGVRSNMPVAPEAMTILPSGLVELKAAYDSSILIRSAGRAQQTSYVETQFGIIPHRGTAPEGPSMRGFLNTALGAPSLGKWNPEHVKSFDSYLVARMSEYLWRRYDQGLIPNEPSPIKPSEARQAIAELEKQFPNFKKAADEVQEFQAQVRRKLYESGIWDKDTFDYTSGFEFYVPMRRVREPGAGHNGGPSMNDGANLSSRVQRLKGSERDVISPLRNIMRQVYFMEREIRQNEINMNFLRQAEALPGEGGKFAERLQGMEAEKYIGDLQKAIRDRADAIGLPEHETRAMLDTLLDGDKELLGTFWRMKQTAARGDPIVFGWEHGKPVAIRLMSSKEGGEHAVFESMSRMPQPVLDVASNLITFFGSRLRSGVIYDPMFPLTNYIKDQLQVALTQPWYIPFVGGLKGIASEVGSVSGAAIGEVARQRAYAGGIMGGMLVGELERKPDFGIQELAKQGYLVRTFTSFAGVLEATQLTEAGTRNSIFEIVYKQKLAQGLSPYEAMMEAGARADDIMPFSRSGSWTQLIRRWVPFLNANMVGQDRYTWRQVLEPQLKKWMGKSGGIATLRDQEEFNRSLYAWGVGGAGMAAMGAAFAATMWAREGYRDARAEVHGQNFVIPMDNGQLFLVPKPFEMSIPFTAGQYAFASWFGKDPRAASQFGDAVIAAMAPPHPIYNLPLIGPYFELESNFSHFRQGPIVPDNIQNKAHPELEYNAGTSSLAKMLGKQIDVSPMKVDYAIGAFFGTIGSRVGELSNALDPDTPTAALDETMFVKRLIKSEERVSGRRKQFWDLMAQKNGKYQLESEAYRKMVTDATVRGQDPVQANELLANLSAPERTYVIMSEAANAQGKPAFNADEKKLHPLVRAREAATILSGIARDLQSNTLIPYREKERLQLDPDQRRKLIDDIRTMAGAEMRNGFAVVGEPGYVGRPIYDTQDFMDVIEKVSPNVAQEISTRYATAKVYSAKAVQEAWPQLRDEVTTYGSGANIKSLSARVRSQGYQFSGLRAKKPGPTRVQITPEPAAATP